MRRVIKYLWIAGCLSVLACGGTSSPAAAPREARAAQAPPIISEFVQGPANNCTSVAFIKAVLVMHGDRLDNLLDGYVRDPGKGLHGVTHGGVAIELTDSELARAAKMAQLIPHTHDASATARLTAAHLLFAVLGKTCQLDCQANGHYCPFASGATCTFDDALAYLDRGLNWDTPPRLLGLREDVEWSTIKGWKPGSWFGVARFVSGAKACVARTPKHSFFVGDGWADLHGYARNFSSKFGSWLAFKSTGAFCLRDVRGAETPPEVAMTDEADSPPAEILADPELRALD